MCSLLSRCFLSNEPFTLKWSTIYIRLGEYILPHFQEIATTIITHEVFSGIEWKILEGYRRLTTIQTRFLRNMIDNDEMYENYFNSFSSLDTLVIECSAIFDNISDQEFQSFIHRVQRWVLWDVFIYRGEHRNQTFVHFTRKNR